MAARMKIWDLGAEGGPKEVEMFAIHAREAMQYDPKRYVQHPPDKTDEELKPVELEEMKRADLDKIATDLGIDPKQAGNKADLIALIKEAQARG